MLSVIYGKKLSFSNHNFLIRCRMLAAGIRDIRHRYFVAIIVAILHASPREAAATYAPQNQRSAKS